MVMNFDNVTNAYRVKTFLAKIFPQSQKNFFVCFGYKFNRCVGYMKQKFSKLLWYVRIVDVLLVNSCREDASASDFPFLNEWFVFAAM